MTHGDKTVRAVVKVLLQVRVLLMELEPNGDFLKLVSLTSKSSELLGFLDFQQFRHSENSEPSEAGKQRDKEGSLNIDEIRPACCAARDALHDIEAR
jgi:hypothetical protein